jgi:lipoprotein-releasing system permease protein
VLDMLEQNKDFVRALNTEKRMLFLAIGLIVIVAALNIGSTLILMVTDKVKEIGTLSAMGARPRGIAVVFMLQGVIIGSVGTVLGLLLGAGISRVLDHFQVIKLDPEVYFLFYVPFVTSPGDLIFAGLLALGVSYVATLYPAWKAATLDPVEAIRHE